MGKLYRRAGMAAYLLAILAMCGALLWYRGVFLAPGRGKTGAWGTLELTLTPAGRFVAQTGQGGTALVSDPGWRVWDFLVGDLDRDGAEELLLLVWRRGHYGPSHPFWVKQNDYAYSQHIFIYKKQSDGEVQPVWMSSALTPQVRAWSMTGDGTLRILTPSGEDTLWGWGAWGIVRLDTTDRPLL